MESLPPTSEGKRMSADMSEIEARIVATTGKGLQAQRENARGSTWCWCWLAVVFNGAMGEGGAVSYLLS